MKRIHWPEGAADPVEQLSAIRDNVIEYGERVDFLEDVRTEASRLVSCLNDDILSNREPSNATLFSLSQLDALLKHEELLKK